jgi:hypothetical protein
VGPLRARDRVAFHAARHAACTPRTKRIIENAWLNFDPAPSLPDGARNRFQESRRASRTLSAMTAAMQLTATTAGSLMDRARAPAMSAAVKRPKSQAGSVKPGGSAFWSVTRLCSLETTGT